MILDKLAVFSEMATDWRGVPAGVEEEVRYNDNNLPLQAAKRDIPFASNRIFPSRQGGYPLSDKGDIPFHGKGISPFRQGGYPVSGKGDIHFSGPEGALARLKGGLLKPKAGGSSADRDSRHSGGAQCEFHGFWRNLTRPSRHKETAKSA